MEHKYHFIGLSNGHLLNFDSQEIKIRHYNKSSTESSVKIVKDTTVWIGEHCYQSNWAVADIKYDILLGMPWHSENAPQTEYENQIVTVGKISFPLCKEDEA